MSKGNIIFMGICILSVMASILCWKQMKKDLEPHKVINIMIEPSHGNLVINGEVKELKKSKSLGEFKLTAYCPCEKCCGKTDGITASGTKATAGRTIGVDPKIIPYGTVVQINGHEYIAEDTGSIKGNLIDIFFNTHDEAKKFGVKYAEVFIVEDIDNMLQK